MANQTIPITLQAGTLPPNIGTLTIQQQFTLFAAYLSAAIRADVTFILNVLTDPTTFQTDIIFNQVQRVFKAWDTASGSYMPVTPFQIGDVKQTFSGADQLSVGWVILDGRAISAVPGLTTQQMAYLELFFGVDGDLPNLVPANINNLPPPDSFSGIVVPVVVPADGVIGALPIDPTYSETEVEALRDATETLRDSTAAVEVQAAAIQEKCGDLLTALRNPVSPPLYSAMFIGFV